MSVRSGKIQFQVDYCAVSVVDRCDEGLAREFFFFARLVSRCVLDFLVFGIEGIFLRVWERVVYVFGQV